MCGAGPVMPRCSLATASRSHPWLSSRARHTPRSSSPVSPWNHTVRNNLNNIIKDHIISHYSMVLKVTDLQLQKLSHLFFIKIFKVVQVSIVFVIAVLHWDLQVLLNALEYHSLDCCVPIIQTYHSLEICVTIIYTNKCTCFSKWSPSGVKWSPSKGTFHIKNRLCEICLLNLWSQIMTIGWSSVTIIGYLHQHKNAYEKVQGSKTQRQSRNTPEPRCHNSPNLKANHKQTKSFEDSSTDPR